MTVESADLKGMKILLVDDTPANIDVLREILKPLGYQVSIAPNGEAAIRIAKKVLPDLIVMDIMMPKMNGIEACRQLKSMEETRDSPIIFMSAKSEPGDLIEGFEAGGIDYITKPFRQEEALARFHTHLKLRKLAKEKDEDQKKIKRYASELEKTVKEKEETILELEAARKKLENYARTDPLTGLSNRRGIMECLEAERKRFDRNGKVFSVLLGDVDFFKKINDSYGHHAGDQILVRLGEIFCKNHRGQDTAGRWGGEEFILVLPDTGLEGAKTLATKIRQAVEKENFVYQGMMIPLTISMSVGLFDKKGQTVDSAIKQADKCLYKAKEQGRNRVAVPQ